MIDPEAGNVLRLAATALPASWRPEPAEAFEGYKIKNMIALLSRCRRLRDMQRMRRKCGACYALLRPRTAAGMAAAALLFGCSQGDRIPI